MSDERGAPLIPTLTRHDDGTITAEWPEGVRTVECAVEMLKWMLADHNAIVAKVNAVTDAAKDFCVWDRQAIQAALASSDPSGAEGEQA
jgi:hypothetical protein